jgi:subtilisin family serine protease
MSTEQSSNDGPGRQMTTLERLSNRRMMLVVAAISIVFLIIAISGVVYYLSKRSSEPALKQPPPSLNELATQYPQISNLLQDKKLDSVYKQFLVEYQKGGMEAAFALARKRGILNENNEIRLTLELDTTDTSALQTSLEAHGVKVTAVSGNLMDIVIPLELVEASLSSDQSGDIFAQLSGLEHILRLRLPETGIQDDSFLDTDIESLSLINAKAWHEAGFTGKGVKIGILDVGFDNYKSLLGSVLPAQVAARSFAAGVEIDQAGETHGTSVAEIIHAIAPDAELVFTIYDTSTEMRQAVEWLVDQDVDIISNSTNFVHGPNDGSGVKARMVDWVVGKGVLWVNSAGNYRLEHYRAEFQDSDGDGWHEFASGDKEMMAIYPYSDASLTLYWNDWNDPSQDFDLYLYDGNENEIASSTDVQNGSGTYPNEYLYYEFPNKGPYYVAFFAKQATRSVTFNFFLRHGEIEYSTAHYSIGTPADSRSSLSVGAVDWQSDQIEDYSSQGPSEDGRLVPEISAPTNVQSDAKGDTFGGTSAACPHVSGAAALVLQAFPDYVPQQVIDYFYSQAVDLGDNGADYDYGNGRLWLGDPPDLSAIIPKPAPRASASPAPTRKSAAVLSPTSSRKATGTPTVKKSNNSGSDIGIFLLLGCVLIPGMLGMSGIGLLGIIWYRNSRKERNVSYGEGAALWAASVTPQPPVAPQVIPEAPLFCTNCGFGLRPGVKFCPSCGHKVG